MFSNSNRLSEQDRAELWQNYIKTRSQELRNQIIEEYAYLVKIIANKMVLYLGTNVEFDDLCSYGIFGLIDAIDKYDLTNNVKFETYASLRIRGEILDNIRKMDWIPRTVRDKQKKIIAAQSQLREKGNLYPKPEDMAKELEVSVDEYLNWETQVLGSQIVSLDASLDNGESDTNSPVATLKQSVYELPEEHIERDDLVKTLTESLELLTDREKLVIQLIYYEDLNAREVAKVIEVSESRVSQIHTRALSKMKDKMGKYMGLLVATP